MNKVRWQTTLWIMFAAQLLSAVGFSVIFPFLPLYVADLGSSTGMSIELLAGLVFSGQAISMAIASPIWGSLSDRLGHKLMVERAMFGGALILLLMGFARSAEELVLLRVVQGMITGTVSAANALVASVAPRDRIGYAMGTLQVGMWSGIAAGPLLGGVLADAFGFRSPFLLTGGLLFAAGLLVFFGVKAGERPAAKPKDQRVGLLASWRTVMTAPGMLLAYSLRFLTSLGQTMLIPFVPLFIQSLMGDTDLLGTFTGLVVGIASAAGTATAISLGKLGDRIGHRQVLIACAFLTGVFYLPQSFVSEPWQLLVLQGLSGAAWGGITPAVSALLARYSATGSEGAVYGLDNSIVSAARACAPLIGAGVVLAGGLRGIFLATAIAYMLIGILAITRLRADQPTVATESRAGD
ncbi:MAG: multidrug efflux MFS transporter [Oscillochloris sp.]|nr:multidrug efflux MFS transporter [Oscillochloris sp.]